MRQLNKWQTAVFLTGALLMVIGAGASVLMWGMAPYVYVPGAIAFTSMQLLQRYEGNNVVLKRLRRMQVVSCLFFLLAALLMFANSSNFLGIPLPYYLYYVHNNWVVVLLIAALLQLYTAHRIGNELEKEAKKR